MPKIFLVADDQSLTDLLRYGFGREGFEVISAGTGREALRLARAERVDLAVLDLTISGMDGLKLLAALRTVSAIPIIVLTGLARDEDTIAGFDAGADDHVSKPFSVPVLIARAKAALRRAALDWGQGTPAGAARAEEWPPLLAGVRFDQDAHALVAEGGARVCLTPTESRILSVLLTHRGQAIPTERIMERVWGYDGESGVAVVKTHIHHLRAKIARLPGSPRPIRTRPGVGYMLTSCEGDADDEEPRIAASA